MNLSPFSFVVFLSIFVSILSFFFHLHYSQATARQRLIASRQGRKSSLQKRDSREFLCKSDNSAQEEPKVKIEMHRSFCAIKTATRPEQAPASRAAHRARNSPFWLVLRRHGW